MSKHKRVTIEGKLVEIWPKGEGWNVVHPLLPNRDDAGLSETGARLARKLSNRLR